MRTATHDRRWTIPEGTPPQKCRGKNCGAEIFMVPYVKEGEHKRMPCDPDGTPHVATCPDAERFRRGR